MCRSIKVLRNADPPATPDDIRAAARQFIRKVSGFHKPSQANSAAFEEAVDGVAAVAGRLLSTLGPGGTRRSAPRRDPPGPQS
ncbi:MAG: DUF2277 domain-containing protein [Acidobacteria bacterium]|nr:DUF2277 domain-containing protein [Acidobacteriota bacterium]